MAVYLPMHKIIGCNSYVCYTPSLKKLDADFEPVVVIWHDQWSRYSAVIEMTKLPTKLQSAFNEERPVIVVSGGKHVHVSSLRDEWMEGTDRSPFSPKHSDEIDAFKAQLVAKKSERECGTT